MSRKMLIGTVALLAFGIGTASTPADAQSPRQRQLAHLHELCDQGYRPACIRFGIMIGQNQGRVAEWRRLHPNWWWWERY